MEEKKSEFKSSSFCLVGVGEKHDVIIVFLERAWDSPCFSDSSRGKKNEVENQQGVTLGVA